MRCKEGSPFAGLIRLVLIGGPVVPTAEKAVETNDATDAIGFVLQTMEDDLHNLSRGHTTKNCGVNEVRAGREFVDA